MMRLKAVPYAEARLKYFKDQLAIARRVLSWWANNSNDPDILAEKGQIVSYYKDIVKMLEGKEHK